MPAKVMLKSELILFFSHLLFFYFHIKFFGPLAVAGRGFKHFFVIYYAGLLSCLLHIVFCMQLADGHAQTHSPGGAVDLMCASDGAVPPVCSRSSLRLLCMRQPFKG